MHESKHSLRLVHDAKDPRFQNLRSLQTRHGRARSGLFLIEGIRHVARAIEARAPIQSVFIEPSSLNNTFGQKLVERLQHSGVRCVRLTQRLYRELTLAAEPQGIVAVVHQQWTPLDSVRTDSGGLWLAVESVDSPGNLGTMMRTAEATGAAGLLVLGDGADPYEPSAARASMGALFALKLVRCSAWEFVEWARASSIAIVGSSPAGLLDFKSFHCRWPAVLVIGSEKRGLSEHLTQSCDFMVRIPMAGRGDSINAAVAAGVLLYELFDQRRATTRKRSDSSRASERPGPC